jgi:hypothetical protein
VRLLRAKVSGTHSLTVLNYRLIHGPKV